MEEWIETAANALLQRRRVLAAVWVALTVATVARAALIQSGDLGATLVETSLWAAVGFGAMMLLFGWWFLLGSISPKLTRRGWSNIFVVASPVLCAVLLAVAPRTAASGPREATPAALFIGMGIAAEIIARGDPNDDGEN